MNQMIQKNQMYPKNKGAQQLLEREELIWMQKLRIL